MSLHRTPADHDADPPSAWQVVKVADRCWHLDSSLGGTFGYYTTRRAAEDDKTSGFYVNLYEQESRWFAGLPVNGWRPYAAILTERATRLGREHGRARTTPYGDLDADDSPLMTALGETSPTTEDNHPRRVALLDAYRDAYTQAREGH